MRHFAKPTLAILLFLLAATAIRAELAPPRLQSVFPTGAKQGSEVEVEVVGSNLDDPSTLYFSHAGITAEYIKEDPPKDDKNKDGKKSDGSKRRFKVKVAADIPVGDYDVRFVGKEGLTNPRTFCISDYAEALEKEPNNERKEANKIEINTTVNGRVGATEDVDWYVVSAKKGQRVIFECRGWRIDSRLDGFMWLYDSEGKQLAQSQDEDIRDEKRDPFIDFEAPADGDYFLKLTDFTYNGSNDYFYRLSINALPYIDFILPPSVPAGSNATITLYGRNLPGGEATDLKIKDRALQKLTKQINLPGSPDELLDLRFNGLVRPWSSIMDGMEVRVKGDGGSSNAKLLRFTTLPVTPEAASHATKETAQKLTVPCSITGQFDRDAPDFYVLSAKKDEKFSIEVFSSRLGSPADPDMEILKPDGSTLANAQDWNENIGQLRFASGTRDITHSFTAPADGDYVIRLEHLFRQAQGGPQYIYQLEVRSNPEPDFRLVCTPGDEIKVDSHLIYQGGRERFDILVWREYGHNDPITVEARNLPAGVTADPIVIGPGVKWGTLPIFAAPDAKPIESVIEVVGTSESKGKKLTRKARAGAIVWDTVNTNALSRVSRSIILAVRPKAPFCVTAAPTEVKVKKGDSFDITVSLKRREDMPNAVQINGAGYALPPGLTIPVKSIDPGQSEVKLTLNTEKIPEGTFSFIVNGDGQVPTAADKNKNIRCVYPSNPVKIIIEPKEKKEEPKK